MDLGTYSRQAYKVARGHWIPASATSATLGCLRRVAARPQFSAVPLLTKNPEAPPLERSWSVRTTVPTHDPKRSATCLVETPCRRNSTERPAENGTPASISEHVQAAQSPTRGTTGRPTKTAMEQYQFASDGLAAEIPKLRKLIETDIKNIEKQLDAAGAPYTPGRLPDWKPGK